MQRSKRGTKGRARVRIDIASSESGVIQVTVARACHNPVVLKLADDMLTEIARRQPNARIEDSVAPPLSPSRGKRGGPAGMPEADKIKIVRGWFQAQGRVKQALYARSQGISAATLRRWIRELRRDAKL